MEQEGGGGGVSPRVRSTCRQKDPQTFPRGQIKISSVGSP